MMSMQPSADRRRAVRAGLAAMILAGLAACGRKGDVVDLLPPPPTPPTPEKASGTDG